MAQINLETALQTINRAVTEHSSATDTQLEDYMMELINSNGEIIDKQPLSRLRDFVYNYLVTNKASDLADLVNSFNPIEFSEFPYLNSDTFFSRSTAGGKQIEGNTATIKAFKGNSLVWNEIVSNGDFHDGFTSGWGRGGTTTITINSDGSIRMTCSESGGQNFDIRQVFSFEVGHKFYSACVIKPSSNTRIGFVLKGTQFSSYDAIASEKIKLSWYGTSTGTSNVNRLVYVASAGDRSQGAYIDVYSVKLFDLTLMFGEGNEPTAEQFEAMFPLDYYEQDNGRILNNAMTHFVSSGTDASGFSFTDTLPIPITQLTGKLNGTGESVTVFPNGLKSAGSSFDTIEKIEGQWYGIENIANINLSDATRIGMQKEGAFYFEFEGKKGVSGYGSSSLVCSKYATIGRKVWSDSDSNDKCIFELRTSAVGYRAGIFDSDYTTLASFTASISGVKLNYVLETPKRYLLDTEWQTLLNTYRVANGGTEMILPVNTSTPATAPAAFDFEYRVIDNEVKRICVENWGGHYVDDEITKYEASQVTTLGTVFQNNQNITNFDELKYFTGLTKLKTNSNEGYFKNSSLISLSFPDNVTDLSYALAETKNVLSADLTVLKGSDINLSFFANNSSVKGDIEEVKLKGTTYTSIQSAFRFTNLKRLIIDGTADFSKCPNFGSVFYSNLALQDITGIITGIKYSITIPSSLLTRASALVLINGLDTVSTTQTITFSPATYALLTSDDIAIATGKGWTVVSAS